MHKIKFIVYFILLFHCIVCIGCKNPTLPYKKGGNIGMKMEKSDIERVNINKKNIKTLYSYMDVINDKHLKILEKHIEGGELASYLEFISFSAENYIDYKKSIKPVSCFSETFLKEWFDWKVPGTPVRKKLSKQIESEDKWKKREIENIKKKVQKLLDKIKKGKSEQNYFDIVGYCNHPKFNKIDEVTTIKFLDLQDSKNKRVNACIKNEFKKLNKPHEFLRKKGLCTIKKDDVNFAFHIANTIKINDKTCYPVMHSLTKKELNSIFSKNFTDLLKFFQKKGNFLKFFWFILDFLYFSCEKGTIKSKEITSEDWVFGFLENYNYIEDNLEKIKFYVQEYYKEEINISAAALKKIRLIICSFLKEQDLELCYTEFNFTLENLINDLKDI